MKNGSLSKKDNINFFRHIGAETLGKVSYLNRHNKNPTQTFEEITFEAINRHARKDPKFFYYRFRQPDDIRVCAQVISLYIEEQILAFLLEDHGRNLHSYLEDLDALQESILENIELITRNTPIDIEKLLTQSRRAANFSIMLMEQSTYKRGQEIQRKQVAQFLQRSNDYYIINALLASNIAQLAERIILRKNLQAILTYQIGYQTWERVDNEVLRKDDPEFGISLLTTSLLQ